MGSLAEQVRDSIRSQFEQQEGSHDWFHIERVVNNALFIQQREGGDAELVELAALLHDIADHKYHGNDFSIGSSKAKELLLELGASEELAQNVADIIDVVSFKGALVADVPISLEGTIVRDADRLDAIGAIGIARAFAYGGSRNRPLYNPDITPKMHQSKEEYAHSKSHTVNHFYEKLLLLKDRMETETAKQMAAERHARMEQFLSDFYQEWNPNK